MNNAPRHCHEYRKPCGTAQHMLCQCIQVARPENLINITSLQVVRTRHTVLSVRCVSFDITEELVDETEIQQTFNDPFSLGNVDISSVFLIFMTNFKKSHTC